MTVAGEVIVHVGDGGSTVQLDRLLAALEVRLRRVDAAAAGLGGASGGPLAGGQQRAASSTLSLIQAQARLAVSQGDLATAVNLYNQALRTEGVGVRESIQIKTQLAGVERKLAAETQAAARANSQVQSIFKGNTAAVSQFSSALSGINTALGTFGIALGAQQLVRFGVELLQVGAAADQTALRFNQAAAAAGTTGEALNRALRQASAGTISDINLQLAANRARLLGVADSAAELAPLLAIARDRAQEMGISTSQAFNDLVTGLGRGSALILDNLGITLSVTEANKAYATSIGKTASQLTEAEQKQALINAVLAQGQTALNATGGAAETTATKLERLNANLDNLKAKLGILVASGLGPSIEGLNRLAGGQQGAAQATASLAQSQDSFLGRLVFGVPVLGQTAEAVVNAGNSYAFLRGTTLAAAAAAAEHAATTPQVTQATLGQADAAIAAAGAVRDHASAMEQAAFAAAVAAQSHATLLPTIQQVTAAMSEDAVMLQQVGIQTDAAAQAAQQHANALAIQTQQSLEAALRTRELSDFQSTLARLGGAVASGLITSANAAAQLARQYNITSGEAARLIGLQAQLGQVSNVAASVGGSAANAAAAADAAALKARNDQILAVGTHTQKVSLLRAEYERLAKQYGATSAQAISAQTRLLQEQDRTTKAAKAGGAARLSDQTKLSNSLLADQEKFQDQSEEAERQHQQKLADIDRDFAKRSLEQQRENDAAKIESRAGFYKSLNVGNRALSQQVRDDLSAAYEAAFAKSQELAQQGNAQLANAYLKLKQEQINAEAQFQKDLADARKDGDAAQVKALQEARELERQAEAEREKQLLEGGDTNVKARQDALDEEERRFQEQQGKIGNAADAAAERKINAALRSGKAIEAENLRLQEQEQIINRIGARQTQAGGTGAPEPTPAPSTVPVPAGGTVVDLAAVVNAISALQPLLSDLKGAISNDTSQTTAAIGRLSGTRFAQ